MPNLAGWALGIVISLYTRGSHSNQHATTDRVQLMTAARQPVVRHDPFSAVVALMVAWQEWGDPNIYPLPSISKLPGKCDASPTF